MKTKRIQIKNYMGIPDLDIATGTINLFSGQNGVGKTSVLEAIKHIMTHDHDPRRIGPNGEFCEVVLSFDNGEIYRMKTKKTGTTWDFRNAKGEPILKSATYVQALVDFLSLDPVEFISLDEKAQVTRFLQSVPMTVDQATLNSIGVENSFLAGIDLTAHALAVIGDEKGGVYKRLYDERTVANRSMKENKTAAMELDKNLGDIPDVATAMKEVGTLAVARDALSTSYSTAREDHINMADGISIGIERTKDEAKAAAQTDYFRKKEQLDADRSNALVIIDTKYNSDVAALREMDKSAREALEANYRPQADTLNLNLGIAQGKLTEANKVAGLLQMRDTHRMKEEEYANKSEVYTTVLEAIKALKTKLVSQSPIPGLEVSAEGLLLNGIPFAITNLAQQIEVAIKIGQLRQKGECGIMLVDNLEHFDQEHLAHILSALDAAAAKCGLQIFGARVASNPELLIENLDKEK